MANLNIPSTRDRTLDAFKGKMVGGGARPNFLNVNYSSLTMQYPLTHQKMKLQIKVDF